MTATESTANDAREDTPPAERASFRDRFFNEVWLGRVLFVVSFVLLIWIWHIWAGTTTPLVLPAPFDVFERLLDYIHDGSPRFSHTYFTDSRAWPHITITVKEIALGFALGSFIGISVGTLASEFSIARRVIMPYVIITQALPKFALAPILVFWFGFGMTPKVIIAALISFFPLLENTYLGLTTTPKDSLELFTALRASRLTTLLKLRVPHAVPTIFSGLRVALMLSLVGAVVAEYVGANKGLGALIIASNGTLDRELMFVAFILLTALGLCLDKIHGFFYRLVMRRLYGSRAVDAGDAGSRVSV